MADLEITGWYTLGLPAYLVAVGLERWSLDRRGVPAPSFARTVSNLGTGLGALLFGLVLAPFLLWLYAQGLALAPWRWPDGSWLEWPVCLLLADLSYYLYHRAGHRVGWMWAIHNVHHQAEEFDVTVAIRMPWLSDAYSFVFYAPIALLGFHRHVFFACLAVISLWAFTVHTQGWHRPSLGFLVTPRSHSVHHAGNARYRGKNLGAMFTLWDRAFGTHAELDASEPPRFGSPGLYRTHDPLQAQLTAFQDLWRARAGWWGPPPRPASTASPRGDAALDPVTTRWVAVQLAGTWALGLWVLWGSATHGPVFQAVGTLLALWGLRTIGGLLDGRPGARAEDGARLLVTGTALLWLAVR